MIFLQIGFWEKPDRDLSLVSMKDYVVYKQIQRVDFNAGKKNFWVSFVIRQPAIIGRGTISQMIIFCIEENSSDSTTNFATIFHL